MLFKAVVSVSLYAAAALAQGIIQFTSVPTSVQAGQSYNLEWTGGDSSPVTIILRSGDPGALDTVETITSGATGGSYSWTVPSDITNGNLYAFEIQQAGQNNYSGQFAVSGGSGTGLPASGTASATGTASGTASASESDASVTGTSSSASASASASETDSSAASTTTGSTMSTSSRTTASRTSASAAATSAPSNNGASGLQSNVALVLGAVAAMFYLA